ncbi:MAG: winged helix-turn-helix domain-containing protein [Rhizobiales bacterium]|nr:winged helix-turn-helix domain-containing protein [Hyphomicrobiales bacterium]
MTIIKINNKQIRKLWLHTNGLAKSPTGALDLMQIIKTLGFVQIDSIQNVTRAHHHILWSRNQNYREHMLDDLLKSKQQIFEHFTHDASILPVEFYPMWQRQFKRKKVQIENYNYFKTMLNKTERQEIKDRIAAEGALSTKAFNTKIKGKKQMWSRPPHKLALDYMWYIGELSTSHRTNFNKYYDLTENIIPKYILDQNITDSKQIDWLCTVALSRLNVGTLKDIKCFWEAVTTEEVKNWATDNPDKYVNIKWQTADGKWLDAVATADIEQKLSELKQPTSKLRIINPFDPAIRDRIRFNNIFGMDYKIEIFVPKEKRKWGYYVYPILEGDKFVGRIELKADRKKSELYVVNFWPDESVNWSAQKHKKLTIELEQFAKFIGVMNVLT